MKKIVGLIIITLVLLVVAGCSSFGLYYEHRGYSPEYINICYPKVGQTTSANLGEPIVEEYKGNKIKLLILEEGFLLKSPPIQVKPGKYEEFNLGMDDMVYQPVSSLLINNFKNLREHQLHVDIYDNIYVVNKAGRKFRTRRKLKDLKHHFDNNAILEEQKFFQRTLIYTGREGNILTFSYREFINNMARPAFTADVSYDLSISKIIGYKKFKAEIIEANNTVIKYKVLSEFESE